MVSAGSQLGGATRVLVTGATGFVGAALTRRLLATPGHHVTVALRKQIPVSAAWRPEQFIASMEAKVDWSGALEGVATVYHLAARVHLLHDTATDPLTAYRQLNVDGTLNLARHAAAAGVKRFVFVSSIKVNGEATERGQRFSENDPPAPVDPYGISKLEAEAALHRLCGDTGLELVVVRPPLVYGPGVKANFLRMLNWVDRGLPLPFGAIDNRRSMVALDNLVDLLFTCGTHPAATGHVFLAGDGEDVSTTELLRRIGRALDVTVRLLPVPVPLLRGALGLVGQSDVARRLFNSLQVDIGKAGSILGWRPPLAMTDALRALANDYRKRHRTS